MILPLYSLVIYIPLGLVALWFLGRTIHGLVRRKWKTAVMSGLGVAAAVASGLLLLPALAPHAMPHDRGRRLCQNHLSQIGMGLMMYSMDHDGAFPDAFVDLEPYGMGPRIFVCRESTNRPGPFGTVDGWTDYALVFGLTETDGPDSILVYCRGGDHPRDRTPVFMTDGSIDERDVSELMGSGEDGDRR